MPRYKDGECIPIRFESGEIESLQVRGHVSEEEFWQIVDAAKAREYKAHPEYPPIPKEMFGPPEQIYGRWMPDMSGEFIGILTTQKTPGRGAFKLTLAELTGDLCDYYRKMGR